MPNDEISQIQLPNGDVYDIRDGNVSDFKTNIDEETLSDGQTLVYDAEQEAFINVAASSYILGTDDNDVTLTDQEGNVQSITVPYATRTDGLAESEVTIGNKIPYNFRATNGGYVSDIGNREINKLVGGTIAWNQLSPDTNVKTLSNTAVVSGTSAYAYTDHLTIIGHVYLLLNVVTEFVSSEISKYCYYYNNDPHSIGSPTPDTLYKATVADVRIFAVNFQSSNVGKMITTMSFAPQCFDLTQMFGPTIADYIYGLETETEGAGVAYFRNLFPESYYDYNAGELMSVKTSAHKMIVLNQLNEEEEYMYPLDTNLELRGIPKLDSDNNLYYDGDTYENDGTVTRKYGIVELSSLSWSYQSSGERFVSPDISTLVKPPASNDDVANIICKLDVTYANNTTVGGIDNSIAITSTSKNIVVKATSAGATQAGVVAYLSGIYLVYELAASTSETADEFMIPQVCDPHGTEEYVDTRDVAIPVGHETSYYKYNDKEKLNSLPDSTDLENGDYIIKQTNGKMTLSPYSESSDYHVYSTDEQVVGRWIDGKDIYEKVVDVGALPNNASKNITHGISNLGEVIQAELSASDNSSIWLTIPYATTNTSDTKYQIGFWITGTNIVIKSDWDRSALSGYAILRYTKSSNTRSLNLSKGSSEELPIEEKKEDLKELEEVKEVQDE